MESRVPPVPDFDNQYLDFINTTKELKMSQWTVKLPGGEFSLTTQEMRVWAESGRLKSDAIVIDQSGTAWTAKQIPGVFSSKDWLTALLLSIFLGVFGVDRFYLGKVGTGITKLLVNLVTLYTFGLIWVVIDLILIATKRLKDKDGFTLA